MLSRQELVELYQKLQDSKVLSVYLDGGRRDPAERTAWSRDLARRLKEEHSRLEVEEPGQVGDFDAAAKLIRDELEGFSAFLPNRGWVAFATAVDLAYAETVPVSMPSLVRWEEGIRVAPYVRGLKQDRTVVAVLADSEKARLFTYRNGEAEERADLIADLELGDLSDATSSNRARMAAAPQRSGTVSGARGEPGSEAAQRWLEQSASRLQKAVAEKVGELAGSDGFVVLGGIPEVVSALGRRTSHLSDRVLERPSLHLGMSEAEVKSAIEDAASELSRHAQKRILAAVIDLARSGGKGCLGEEATERALRERRVDTLLISRTLRERHPDRVDHLVGGAFEQGASVEELSGAGADRLDTEGGGIAARLRYTVQ